MKLLRPRHLVALSMVVFLFVASANNSSADTLVMPRELVDLAHANGCSPISDFFERPGMVNPPYAYGWLPGDPGSSAVFWCKGAAESKKPYKLVFKVADPKQLRGCSATIEWSYPRGLSIETRHNLALRDFHYITAPQRAAPTTVVANARVIVNEYDGPEDIFYCYGGEWLVSSLE
jgi:hypothetical protein